MTTRARGRRSVQPAVALLFAMSLGAPTSEAGQQVSGEGVRPESIALFDGSSLEGWRAEHTRARARDGVLAVERGSGWVRTEQPFADFVLKLEFRMTGTAAKAGVFVRAWPTFDPGTHVPNNGYRLAFNNRQRSDTSASERAAWRRLEIECVGRSLRVHLDGALVHEANDVENPQGYIAVFSETGIAGSDSW